MLRVRPGFSRLPFAGAALFVLLAAPHAAQAQTLINDNFNTEGGGFNYTSFVNWNVTRGSVDVLGFYPGFGGAVDMDGSTGAAGRLETKSLFALAAGDYSLSFALGKNGGALETMNVSVGTAFTTVVSDALAYPTPLTRTFNFSVLSGTTGRIVFDHAGGDNAGYILDNVVLTRVTNAAAPEPASLALLLGAAVPLAGLVRRRRQVA